jgi:Fe-S-cluster containining protein
VLIPIHSCPSLQNVHREIFELRYYSRCMSCDFCSDSCCQWGADTNVGERDRILAHADSIQRLVSTPVSQWFTTEVHEDDEYPTGKYVRTQRVNGACAFLNRNGRGCLLHQWAMEEGRDYHEFKPMICWLFPVVFDRGVLRASFDVRDGLVCVGEGETIYRSTRSELKAHFGAALVEELDAIEASLAKRDTGATGDAA